MSWRFSKFTTLFRARRGTTTVAKIMNFTAAVVEKENLTVVFIETDLHAHLAVKVIFHVVNYRRHNARQAFAFASSFLCDIDFKQNINITKRNYG